jgi:hypothetical protein
VADRLWVGDFRTQRPTERFAYLVAIQVFQHGDGATRARRSRRRPCCCSPAGYSSCASTRRHADLPLPYGGGARPSGRVHHSLR